MSGATSGPQTSPREPFAASGAAFGAVVGFLRGTEAATLNHAELENQLQERGRDLLRQLYQDHLDLRAEREERIVAVSDDRGLARAAVEPDHERGLHTVFGEVCVRRLAYRRRGLRNLHPADGALNLPAEAHSHGLRHLAAIESSRGSFADAAQAIATATGVRVGKRQVEALAGRAASDFDDFYARRRRCKADSTAVGANAAPGDVVVLSADGKGIVMRPEALRAATAARAERSTTKLATRLSRGEKANRKRMAEVGAVYEITPVPRCPDDILVDPTSAGSATPGPHAKARWLTASVVENAGAVIGKVFDEAQRRDPDHQRCWVALVDGNVGQLRHIKDEAKARCIDVAIVVDFIHVLEYLWSAVWCFFAEGDPKAEAWVREKALAVLRSEATTVAASVRRKATCLRLDKAKRANADRCADYLLHKAPYLDYRSALEKGWPIATGVIEGACRHLVKDRMDLTGARWGLDGAEAVLKLRALRANDDFPSYWAFHLEQERNRVHGSRYANGVIPRAA